MAAVIRMKRHIDEVPLNAFVLNCKRRKTDGETSQDSTSLDNGSKEETSTILKFAGTITENENTSAHISRLTKEEAREIISKTRAPNLTGRNRQELRETAQNNRFKIVNCTRALDNEASGAATDADNNATAQKLTIVDVVKDKCSNTTDANHSSIASTSTGETSADTSSSDKFVYDLYFSETNDLYYPENIEDLSVMDFHDFMYSTHREGKADTDSDSSDDSNDENNWRNDYPDEDEYGGSSIDDDDMRRAVEEFDLNDDRALSSDEDDEDYYKNTFTHTIYDKENISSYHDDVLRYGKAYANKKIKYLKDLNSSKLQDDFDDDEEEEEEKEIY